ncbi:DUF5133 domain-containing protein [Streptomyces sp. NPDC058251]|uniref:DUF5133 domain-containing protein n=1 Tax=unclassified Streptomyces TaxID=2593676 RepID=UPI003654441A
MKIERGALAVLVPDPKVVRRLLTRYACLKIAYAEKETLETARELEDVTYTLCVMTGTNSVQDAVVAADALLIAGSARREVAFGGERKKAPAAARLAQPHVDLAQSHVDVGEVSAMSGQGGAAPGALL